ncbi:MAG TPA: DUF6235 family protein [Actinophytocola sp.]|uniref:DUF6235 family protein n=1 Tax=Actinophytocola sp. TaxID=1872138 RepID=UPI002DDC9787|nr:DUF6235 family protein [Actinophytocola sp.]HEV2781541.1 DUF6235 family protein [Actinophytocola sp.]
MNPHIEPAGSIHRPRFRMDTGLEVLERWADTATPSEKNAVYKALFAVADGSVFKNYRIVDDWQKLSEFFVLVKDNLVVKVCVHCFDSYGIVYIGPRQGAPGLGSTGFAA